MIDSVIGMVIFLPIAKEIADEAVVCIGCGRPVQPVKATLPPAPIIGDDNWSSGAMADLVIASVFIPILGIILGVIYMSNNATSPERNRQAKTLLINHRCLDIVVRIYFPSRHTLGKDS